MTHDVQQQTLSRAAEILGYERVAWDDGNDCFSGYGSSDPVDRSRDDTEGRFVAWNLDELQTIVEQG